MSQERTKKQGSKKRTRAFQVLMGCVELYLETGKPIGSHTLQEHAFPDLSSATIRNYFVELEKQHLLQQPHSSGGRLPTQEALRLYATENKETRSALSPEEEIAVQELKKSDARHLMRYLQEAADQLSELTGLATFLSSVRFDQDLILEIKLVSLDPQRLLCVILTDFGQILTEIMTTKQKWSAFALKRIETYLQWRVKGSSGEPVLLAPEEEAFAQITYNEVLVRYLVRYSNFSGEDVYRTGFSKLLAYPEFSDPIALASGLCLFENTAQMRLLLNDCVREGELRFWIDQDLAPYASATKGCAVVAVPYCLGHVNAGAVGVLGPARMPYKGLFSLLRHFAAALSHSLTRSLIKFKLSFRHPRTSSPYPLPEERAIIDQTKRKLLEIKE